MNTPENILQIGGDPETTPEPRQPKDTPSKTGDSMFRDVIAKTLLWFTLAALTVISITVMLLDKGRQEKGMQIFNSLLPVFGTWIGTLLAFYFSRENFVAAQKSVEEANIKAQKAQQEVLKTVQASSDTKSETIASLVQAATPGAQPLGANASVSAKMIPYEKIHTFLSCFKDRDPETLPLPKVIEALQKQPTKRLPHIDEKQIIRYVVDLPSVNRFVTEQALAKKQIDTLTLNDVLEARAPATVPLVEDAGAKAVPVIWRTVFSTVAVIPETGTMADADQAMRTVTESLESLAECVDVFVTETGSRAEPVKGWLTRDMVPSTK